MHALLNDPIHDFLEVFVSALQKLQSVALKVDTTTAFLHNLFVLVLYLSVAAEGSFTCYMLCFCFGSLQWLLFICYSMKPVVLRSKDLLTDRCAISACPLFLTCCHVEVIVKPDGWSPRDCDVTAINPRPQQGFLPAKTKYGSY